MFDTLTPRSTTGEFETMPGARPDPGGFLLEARTGAREAAAHMKDLAERFAELRNAIMRLPGNPSCDDRAGLRHRLLHLEHTLMSARGSLDDAVIGRCHVNHRVTSLWAPTPEIMQRSSLAATVSSRRRGIGGVFGGRPDGVGR